MVKLLLLVVWIVSHLISKFGVDGDNGNDLFSSTDDMKKLFNKEIQFSGRNDRNISFIINKIFSQYVPEFVMEARSINLLMLQNH